MNRKLIVVDLDFSHRDLAQGNSSRGPKKAGTMKIVSGVSDAEDAREKSTFLVTYGTLSDIPWTPLESLATNDQHPQEPGRPRIIPLPAELRVSLFHKWVELKLI